jgi:hypothetical protein
MPHGMNHHGNWTDLLVRHLLLFTLFVIILACYFIKIILIGRTDFIYFVHMFLGILPSSATREPRFLVGFVLLDQLDMLSVRRWRQEAKWRNAHDECDDKKPSDDQSW